MIMAFNTCLSCNTLPSDFYQYSEFQSIKQLFYTTFQILFSLLPFLVISIVYFFVWYLFAYSYKLFHFFVQWPSQNCLVLIIFIIIQILYSRYFCPYLQKINFCNKNATVGPHIHVFIYYLFLLARSQLISSFYLVYQNYGLLYLYTLPFLHICLLLCSLRSEVVYFIFMQLYETVSKNIVLIKHFFFICLFTIYDLNL